MAFIKLALFTAAMLSTGYASAETIQILFTHDGMGELEPCGCRSNPLGGVVRRSALSEKLKKEAEKTFQVEIGNSFFENSTTPEGMKSVLKYQSEKIAESFPLFPLHLFVPGEKDFSLGLEHLLKLKTKAKTPFLAANLSGSKKTLPFLKSKADKVGAKSILWVGLVGEDLSLPEGLQITDPETALRAEMQKQGFKSETHFLVVLSQLGMEKDRELVKKIPEIHLILGSRDQSFTQIPVNEGKTTLLQTSYRNQHIGRVRLALESGKIESEFIPLDESYDPSAPEKALKLVAEWKAGVEKLSRVNAVLDDGKKSKIDPLQTFVNCASCHEPVFNFWRKTDHANALHPLKEKSLLTHPSCLKCHTVSKENPAILTNVGRKGDWKENELLMNQIIRAENMDSSIKLFSDTGAISMRDAFSEVKHVRGSVQCESCHVSTGNHPFSGSMPKSVPDSTCIKCHTQERAPSWYNSKGLDASLFAEKRKKVQCPHIE